MEQAVILSAVRAPIGKFMGRLSSLTAPELGARVVSEPACRAGISVRHGRWSILVEGREVSSVLKNASGNFSG